MAGLRHMLWKVTSMWIWLRSTLLGLSADHHGLVDCKTLSIVLANALYLLISRCVVSLGASILKPGTQRLHQDGRSTS